MKTRATAPIVLLKDLPAEGQDFEFSNQSGELNEVLKDLVGQNPYKMDLHISPQGNSFDLRGNLQTAMDMQCSICAEEFKHPVNLNLHEFIVIEEAMGKGDQMIKANHAHEWEAEGPNYIVLPSETFNIGEYVHEAIALAEPIRPVCAPDRPEQCAHRNQRVQRPWLTYEEVEKTAGQLRASPFQVLEKMKLKS